MDYNSMKYRESLICLRNFINTELDSIRMDPNKFIKPFHDKADDVESNAYVLILEGAKSNEVDNSPRP